MSTYRKVVVARTLFLIALVGVAAVFVFGVAADRDDGALLDEEGVVTEDIMETTPGT